MFSPENLGMPGQKQQQIFHQFVSCGMESPSQKSSQRLIATNTHLFRVEMK